MNQTLKVNKNEILILNWIMMIAMNEHVQICSVNKNKKVSIMMINYEMKQIYCYVNDMTKMKGDKNDKNMRVNVSKMMLNMIHKMKKKKMKMIHMNQMKQIQNDEVDDTSELSNVEADGCFPVL
ncbi:MAG: hypothetical protein EZS28_026776 [Streblomastix strix]|uniref:Uncharacterized protein n=1 Tax=Streblomastix strix TaxID=222440 RepID=A0A5J4V520_9EUKA|nr:MAG: hypothetical protein EZS28_026776 [Streblomastix strix]